MPLADKLRPEKVDDIIGQQHLLGEGSVIRKMIKSDKIKSMVLWGKAGIGKTTIARCIANETASAFQEMNATNSKIADIRKFVEIAEKRKKNGTDTIVFVDEIHRWAKNIQDALLPCVEDGTIILVGATTEKPQFAVNSALLSRVQCFELKELSKKDMLVGLTKAIKHYKDLGKNISISKNAAMRLINRCSGDIRKLITSIETIVDVLLEDATEIENDHVDLAIPDKFYYFDKGGNEHFDMAAAWQNSVQNSDADQAIFFLAKWLLSGEDPVYIARRILISSSEDACLNPNAAMIANNAYVAAKEIGYPECKIPMAHATIEICNSPRKKIANDAINQAIYDIENGIDVVDLGEMGAGKHDGYSKIVNKKYVKNED